MPRTARGKKESQIALRGCVGPALNAGQWWPGREDETDFKRRMDGGVKVGLCDHTALWRSTKTPRVRESYAPTGYEKAQMTETQRQYVSGKKLKTVFHLNTADGGVLQQENRELGIVRIVRTPKVKGRWQRQTVTWCSKKDVETEFDSLSDLLTSMGVS